MVTIVSARHSFLTMRRHIYHTFSLRLSRELVALARTLPTILLCVTVVAIVIMMQVHCTVQIRRQRNYSVSSVRVQPWLRNPILQRQAFNLHLNYDGMHKDLSSQALFRSCVCARLNLCLSSHTNSDLPGKSTDAGPKRLVVHQMRPTKRRHVGRHGGLNSRLVGLEPSR